MSPQAASVSPKSLSSKDKSKRETRSRSASGESSSSSPAPDISSSSRDSRSSSEERTNGVKSKRRNDRKEWSRHSHIDEADVSLKKDQKRKVQSSPEAEKRKARAFYVKRHKK